ncbi:hypothetical protein PRIPAC_76573 [Pristionchus pacificus]|uniref:Uncharacterized protein n=1 Tax=Pristionchus pacificus TaxID=54126 RepID=A0A2A6C746_PRIPA|nr:hypothetical protein PRIPAC_76573 [Pristionchus pacificus]|eukprot:PDM74015.1 hypothetical protein PRIPAC_41371 [Pristionchus pacificus]
MSSCSPIAATTVVSHRLFVYRSESESISRTRLAHIRRDLSMLIPVKKTMEETDEVKTKIYYDEHRGNSAVEISMGFSETIANRNWKQKLHWTEVVFRLEGYKFALMEEKTILAWILRHFKIKSSERRFEMKTKMERVMRPQKGTILVTFRPHLKTNKSMDSDDSGSESPSAMERANLRSLSTQTRDRGVKMKAQR